MSNSTTVGLLGPPQIGLRNEYEAHGKHTETTKFLRGVKDTGRETRRHLRVKTNLDTSLDLVFGLDKRIKQLVGVHDGLSVISHQTNKTGVPLIDDLRKSGTTRAHENLSDTVVEILNTLVRDTQKRLGSSFFGRLLSKIPNAVFQRVSLAVLCTDSGKDSDFETAHGKQELRVILGVDRDKCVFPFDGSERPRQRVLDIPEDCTTKVYIMLDKPHSTISGPAPLVVITDDVFVVRIRLNTEISLDKVSRLLSGESEQHMDTVDVSRVETDGVFGLDLSILELKETVGCFRKTGDFTGSLKTKDEKIKDETVVLEDE